MYSLMARFRITAQFAKSGPSGPLSIFPEFVGEAQPNVSPVLYQDHTLRERTYLFQILFYVLCSGTVAVDEQR